MEDVTISTRVLNGFLTLMVGVLVLILIGVVVCLILTALGIL
ncbi:hypothetical protein Celal_2019 [Cellulophaga algicola DSM 14237]|uniref:Uncharacterized protein n=1 Tax=Cellulophaga algicola (strain DSM 14237 / IC166 / ACAM 630) TaxID=688270 RepID=E6X3Z1_CELAD|nr:hypothetical protein Celal_2019 [Cellulophaga algicola DSM 14237]